MSKLTHMTYTGYAAGNLLCNMVRNESIMSLVHASYAPLNNPEYRKQVCLCCLKVWADYAYDEVEEMPDYIREIRDNG